jgi:hypothetical protein
VTGGTSIGSCVTQYNLNTLRQRSFAFDGTVRSVARSGAGAEESAPDIVTFDVHRWFEGGTGTSASRKAIGFGAVTSAGGQPHGVGDRHLVAGEEDYLWQCGFTQPYGAKVAADWPARSTSRLGTG